MVGASIIFHTHTHPCPLLMSNSVWMRGVLLYIVPLGHWHMCIFYRCQNMCVHAWVMMFVSGAKVEVEVEASQFDVKWSCLDTMDESSVLYSVDVLIIGS